MKRSPLPIAQHTRLKCDIVQIQMGYKSTHVAKCNVPLKWETVGALVADGLHDVERHMALVHTCSLPRVRWYSLFGVAVCVDVFASAVALRVWGDARSHDQHTESGIRHGY